MMDRFFTFLQTYRSGILFLIVCLACVAFLLQWFAWIFGFGRFRRGGPDTRTGTGPGSISASTNLRYLFSGAIVKIVNDFRHLLALVIVLIFAFALGYSLWKAASLPAVGDPPSVINNMKEALQAVVATLGGLVGSIIGYYFGESTSAKPPIQTPQPDTSPITAVTPPTPVASADTVEG